ncbi:MAG TPA: GH3 auxin-responsive promoter family protein [Flavobacteriaceae bacterium]|nr:GH3 auxin-responsive promoter family protein [Flavobacteriaceae bacterium]
MSLKGTLIKNLIGIGEGLVSEANHVSAQAKTLTKLLERAKETAFGKFYGFDEILNSKNPSQEFKNRVPYFDYNKMENQWWKQTQKGIPDISWPGTASYFALSSGTTGSKSKRIPVTEDMLDAIRKAGIKQVAALSNFDLPPEFFEREILMLGSSTNLKENSGRWEGEISGIGASNIPFWFRGYYRPGNEIAKIDDWDERLDQIAQNAKEWDIGALSGIPSWMELMIKKVIEYHGVDNIHQIWPNLQVYASGGVAFEAYEKSFFSLLGKPITVIETYLASEGFLACQTRPETTAMQLLTDNGVYFEFVPFKPEYIHQDGSLKDDAPCTNLEGVKPNQEYVLLISTVSGAWRYLIGDTIEFSDVDKAEIKITGRTKFFLNVVGSQLSVNKMNEAILGLENQFNLKIPEFVVSAVKINDEYYHKWYLGVDSPDEMEEKTLAQILDKSLQEANKNYAVARSKSLKGVVVRTIPVNVFYEWNAFQKKKGGQVKTEKVMKEEKFLKWEKFVSENC